MSDASGSSRRLERLEWVAERARRELLAELSAEADSLDRELDAHSERISADLSLALDCQLDEAADLYRKLLGRQLEANAAALRAETERSLAAIRAEIDGMLREARAELDRLLGEVARVTAAGLTERLEQKLPSADSRERFDEVLERLRAADRRLRDSDARTRRALGQLRALD